MISASAEVIYLIDTIILCSTKYQTMLLLFVKFLQTEATHDNYNTIIPFYIIIPSYTYILRVWNIVLLFISLLLSYLFYIYYYFIYSNKSDPKFRC